MKKCSGIKLLGAVSKDVNLQRESRSARLYKCEGNHPRPAANCSVDTKGTSRKSKQKHDGVQSAVSMFNFQIPVSVQGFPDPSPSCRLGNIAEIQHEQPLDNRQRKIVQTV